MFVAATSFRWIRGESRVLTYKVPEAQRFSVQFCEKCGSGLPRYAAGAPVALVPAGTLDTAIHLKPTARIFVGSKAPWLELFDDIPRYEEMPPREVMTRVAPPAPR
jgi:hypothetical protein